MDLLSRLVSFLSAHNAEAYFVGGFVRDVLLEREVRDIDISLRGNAIALARAFADANGGAFYLMDAEHGVARTLFGEEYVDFAELRGDLLADLATRDFTINAIAQPITHYPLPITNNRLAITNDLVDPFGGLKDIQARQIRAVSDGVFEHDAVRLLRALRIAGELDFAVEPHTEAQMRRDAARLANAPMERARDEFFKILAQPDVVTLLRRADELGLLDALLPEVMALKSVTQPEPHVYDVFEHSLRTVDEIVRIQANDYREVGNGEFVTELQAHFGQVVSAGRTRETLLRLTALLHDIGKPATRSVDEKGTIHFYSHEARGAAMTEEILRRLRLSNDEIRIATRTVEEHLRPPQLARAPHFTNRAIYRLFRAARDTGIDVCVLALADTRAKTAPAIGAEEDARLRAVLTRLLDAYFRQPESIVVPPSLLDGRTLMREMHLEPGPQLGELLEQIREAQAEGEVRTREDALALARKIVYK